MLTLVAIAICIFIRTIVPETMPNPKPYVGAWELLHDLFGCFPSAAGAGKAQPPAVEGGFGFGLLTRGPDDRGNNSRDAVLRRRYVHVSCALVFIGGFAGGASTLTSNYVSSQANIRRRRCL